MYMKLLDNTVKKTLRIGSYSFTFRHLYEFFTIYKSIFWFGEYKFRSNNSTPFIIDCGAHIGISITYFKKLFPKSRILAFEPNPDTFRLLSENMAKNRFAYIRLENKALSDKKGKTKFFISNGKNGSVSCGDSIVPNPWISKETHNAIMVETTKLSGFIAQPVDLLKIDVEGMEGRILTEIQHKLHFVHRIVFEFHGNNKNKQNTFSGIYALLTRHGFTCRVFYPASLFRPIKKEISPAFVDDSQDWVLIGYAENTRVHP
jgi:FkbM family methyltransferase